MTIEMSPKASPVTPQGQAASGKPRAGSAQDEGAENGFSALLASADEETSDAAPGATTSKDNAAAQASALPLAAVDPGAAQDAPVVDASALLAQSMVLNPASAEGTTAHAVGKHPSASSALAEAGADRPTLNPFVAQKPDKGVGAPAAQQDAADTSTLAVASNASAKSVAQEFKEALPQEMFKALQTAVESLPAAATTVREKAPVEQGAKSAPADNATVGFASSSGPLGADGVVSPQSAATVESFVAEQVTYWIGQDVQNAELKLDGLGVDPVEVSITMQGKEAHVAFRTDEVQARDALENATAHLKELLDRQGVILSGVSVGTSHRGDTSGQGRQARPDGRRGLVSTQEPVAVEAQRPSRVANGRTVDLFV
jgi:flagellar hook-length control protein FliK